MKIVQLSRKSLLMTVLTVFLLVLTMSTAFAAENPPTWWTPWYDRDNPSGTGDWELRSLHRTDGDVCWGQGDPISFEAETLSGIPALSTGETFLYYGSGVGLVCRNADQGDGACLDYRVRYRCLGEEPW